MANRAALFREADLARVFRAAKSAGVHVRVDLLPGVIKIETTDKGAAAASNSFDEMMR
jgi:hypothetical protein